MGGLLGWSGGWTHAQAGEQRVMNSMTMDVAMGTRGIVPTHPHTLFWHGSPPLTRSVIVQVRFRISSNKHAMTLDKFHHQTANRQRARQRDDRPAGHRRDGPIPAHRAQRVV